MLDIGGNIIHMLVVPVTSKSRVHIWLSGESLTVVQGGIVCKDYYY